LVTNPTKHTHPPQVSAASELSKQKARRTFETGSYFAYNLIQPTLTYGKLGISITSATIANQSPTFLREPISSWHFWSLPPL